METRKIIKNFRELVGGDSFQTKLCKVISVEGNYCEVEAVSGQNYQNITINANPEEEKGIMFRPKIGSYVLVEMKDEFHGFVSQFSEIDSAKINIAENIIEVKEKSITITCGDSKIEIDDKNIVFNGGDNDGLVKVKELTEKINATEDKINELLNTLKSISVALAPSGTFPFAPIFAAVTPIVKTQKTEIENDKIKH